MTRKTKRIYYGPDEDPTLLWWDVEWSNATKGVVINGTLEHAIEGMPGHSIGCRLSNAAADKQNESAFPHPAIIAAFYKRTALIVDKLAKNGTPIHAVVYEHDYADFVNMNDDRTMEPIYKDKRFYLRVPQKEKTAEPKDNDKLKRKGHANGSGGVSAKAFKVNDSTGHPASSTVSAKDEFHPSITHNRATFSGGIGRAKRSGLLGRTAANQLSRVARKLP